MFYVIMVFTSLNTYMYIDRTYMFQRLNTLVLEVSFCRFLRFAVGETSLKSPQLSTQRNWLQVFQEWTQRFAKYVWFYVQNSYDIPEY